MLNSISYFNTSTDNEIASEIKEQVNNKKID